ncbi:hypothetical protein [Paraflavitalea sp. CAU 1676]|uniref:hypothetical protein n=1 Tax=Paraflavitalea sp. CAU 1676 TaxID=3032598 RepID=UPI0023DBD590|nr:hypothetical protein [Paraflavitalea sp. CAU 1676]MDF2189324.1 hypothetical protein [Paraflavitalea sp. CAU 1676]
MPDNYVQIDVKNIKDGFARCNMYTGGRCVQIVMQEADYKELIRDGFFIRDGKSKDSADVINTTKTYIPE